MVQPDGAEFRREFHAVRLFRKAPGRIAAAAHLDFAVGSAVPPPLGRMRAVKFDRSIHIVVLAGDLTVGLHAQHRQFGVDLRAVERNRIGPCIAVFGHDHKGYIPGEGDFRFARHYRNVVHQHPCAVGRKRRDEHRRLRVVDPFQVHRRESPFFLVEIEYDVVRQVVFRAADAEGQQIAPALESLLGHANFDVVAAGCGQKDNRRALRAVVGLNNEFQVVLSSGGQQFRPAPRRLRVQGNLPVGRHRCEKFAAVGPGREFRPVDGQVRFRIVGLVAAGTGGNQKSGKQAEPRG